jgi:hypothetical protein
MGTADTCPTCGWSYAAAGAAGPELTALPPAKVETASPPESKSQTEPEPAVPSAAVPSQAGWGEVTAVLAVGVVPSCLGALPGPVFGPAPYWADTITTIVYSACTAFVTLYLIRRSGEPWERFGLHRPAVPDAFLGIGMLVVAELVLLVELRLGTIAGFDRRLFPVARGPAEYGMMIVKYLAYEFASELVTRAYLITRLEVLLGSRGSAVILSAAAFASGQAYQGAAGLVGAFLFGLAYGMAYLGVRRVWPFVLGHALFDMHLELAARPLG